jgi:hypothetical protein
VLHSIASSGAASCAAQRHERRDPRQRRRALRPTARCGPRRWTRSTRRCAPTCSRCATSRPGARW